MDIDLGVVDKKYNCLSSFSPSHMNRIIYNIYNRDGKNSNGGKTGFRE